MSKIDSKFIINLKGKDFVTYEGLLDLAHQDGLISIRTELIQIPTEDNNFLAIVKAVASTDKGVFEGIGDADNKSVGSNIAVHKIRMAETRAKARALRDLTNVGMTALEEMGGDDETPSPQSNPIKSSILSEKQISRLYAIAKAAGVDDTQIHKSIKTDYKKDSVNDLTKKEYDHLCERLEKAKK